MTTVIDGTTGIDKVKDGSIGQADLGPNVAGNGPAFRVTASGGVTLNTTAKVSLTSGVKVFDTASAFTLATSRFQPTVGGYYQINANLTGDGLATSMFLFAKLYVNGTSYVTGVPGVFNTQYWSSSVSALVYLNGSSDYLELWATVVGSTVNTTGVVFDGFLARAA